MLYWYSSEASKALYTLESILLYGDIMVCNMNRTKAENVAECEWLIANKPELGYEWLTVDNVVAVRDSASKRRMVRAAARRVGKVAPNLNGFPMVYALGDSRYKILVKNRERRGN